MLSTAGRSRYRLDFSPSVCACSVAVDDGSTFPCSSDGRSIFSTSPLQKISKMSIWNTAVKSLFIKKKKPVETVRLLGILNDGRIHGPFEYRLLSNEIITTAFRMVEKEKFLLEVILHKIYWNFGLLKSILGTIILRFNEYANFLT